jgi:hypothetical protein
MKFTFIAELSEDVITQPFKNTLETEADHIDDVIENFKLFLKGTGFHTGNSEDFFKKD